MEARLRLLFLSRALLAAALAVCAPGGWAQEPPVEPESVVQPEVSRTRVDLAEIDTEDFEVALFAGPLSIEDFGVDTVLGLRLSYHITPSFFADVAYGRADAGLTSFERLSGGVRLLSEEERELEYLLLSLGYNALPGEVFLGERLTFNTALYLLGGIGVTRFAGEDRFTVSYGFGFRLLATDWLALHLGLRDHRFQLDVLGEDKSTHNIELQGAVSIFF